MAKPPNEKIERHYFENFRKAYLLPDGIVIYGDKPDVVIQGERKIGVEMTNFFLMSGNNPDSEQRQRPLRGLILAGGWKLYRASGGRNDVNLTVCFDGDTPISSVRRKKLPQELADLLHTIHHRESGAIQSHLFRNEMPEIFSIWLHSKQEVNAKWRLNGLHGTGLMDKNALEAIVREKEAKSGQYQQCDAHWLLVVVDGMDPAQDQEPRISDPRILSHVFEKIIVYETLFGRIVEAK